MKNATLDEAVTTTHDWDRHQADRLLDLLVTMPPKRDARLAVIAILESAREQGAGFPALAFEMAYRRGIADPTIEDEQLEQLDRRRLAAR